jgi:hypothetical protein
MDRLRLKYSATIFLLEMQRQAILMDKPESIGKISNYSPKHRSALMAGLEKAHLAVDSRSDKAFESWLGRQDDLEEKSS